MKQMQAALITISDKGFAGTREDASGPEMRLLLEAAGARVVETRILPDERETLAAAMRELCDAGGLDLLLTSGGTGLAPRDCTPEATADVTERAAPGIPEAIRARSLRNTDRAMLSRATAGVRGRTLIVNLPGSPRAVRECLDVLLPVLGHAVETLRGEAYECAAPQSPAAVPAVGAPAASPRSSVFPSVARSMDAPISPAAPPPVQPNLSHLDGEGNARMVDVGEKTPTARTATARAVVKLRAATLEQILAGGIPKGDVFSCARIAGIMAAKRTHELIPMCHPLPVTGVSVQLTPQPPDRVLVDATVKCVWQTGVEMEALTAASVAGLTIYDMCKAIDREIELEQVRLLHKAGGRSGEFFAPGFGAPGKGALAR